MSAKSGKTIGRKQVNRAIEGSEALMQAIFDNALDGILLADIESRRFVAGNNMICRMLGYSPDELKELTVADIHPPEDLQHVLEQFEQQTQREITLAENVPVKRKDGSVFFADINASPVEQHGRKLMAGFFRDITERKQAEDGLKQRLEEIERMNRMMVGREMKMEELRKEIKMLKAEIAALRSKQEPG